MKITPKGIFLLTLALAVQAGLITLSLWQYGRYQQRTTQQAAFSTQIPHTLTATFISNTQAMLDNQPHPTNPQIIGQRLLAAAQTTSQTYVVDLGWLPFTGTRTAAPTFTSLPTTPIALTGIFTPLPVRKGWLTGADTTSHPRRFAFLNPTLLTSTTVAPSYLQLTQTITPSIPNLITQPAPPPAPIKHLSYALQWLGMALVFPLLCFFAARRRP